MRVLVVEDERPIAEFIERGLSEEGYDVTAVHDGEEGLTRALSGEFSVVLLDVLLPKLGGFDVLKRIRAEDPALPVIMLTALGETADKVAGLDSGANDYLAKPFAFDELLARIRAQLRDPSPAGGNTLRVGGLELDFRTRRVEREGEEIPLTTREFELLAHLMRHPDQVLSRAQLLSAVWGYDYDPGTNVLEVYVGYLRRKLSANGGVSPIQTVRSAGYRLVSGDA
ncbi:MAG: two-component system, OmpR family, response regulator [Solirubrobacterales bacterium]|jgi:DNA-binding response OmpR family regulator|nr:two-component system, OmpR family, response regulator [Solirubrobacterales bacterium]